MNINEQVAQPKWLLELENRKRKPRLAHEAGAGSPCLTCTTACPGLDLHFWRKICKNCKCSRDEHDVCDDDFPQFDLLFGPNSKSKTRPQRLRLNNKQLPSETMFEWVPPNTTKELAEDYMKALPVERLPIKGSAGAALRKQQLQKQIPLHDIDYQACDELTDKEKIEFQQYLENLKKCAGQGKVFKFFTPAEFVRTQREAMYENSEPTNVLTAPSINLRTPSCFNRAAPIPSMGCANSTVKTAAANFPILKSRTDASAVQSSDNVNLGRYHCAMMKDQYKNNISNSSQVEKNVPCESLGNEKTNEGVVGVVENLTDPGKGVEFSSVAQTAEMMFSKEFMAHEMLKNDIVGSTLDKNKLQFIREQLQLKYACSDDAHRAPVSKSTDITNSSAVSSPAYLVKDKLTVMNSSIDDSNNLQTNINNSQINSNKNRPFEHNPQSIKAELDKRSAVGNQFNSVETNNPVFPEYSISKVCQQSAVPVEELEANIQALTVQAKSKKSCHECGGQINSGDVVVTAEKAEDAVWHPGCFVCTICHELLADLVYFYHKKKLYCARDFATSLKIPRCFACDELIFVRGYTVAEGHTYHLKHFCCWDCDKPLAGQQYTPENDRPLCLPCYQENYAKTCSTCKKIIAANQQGVCVKNLDFHVNSECFCCYECKISLLNSRMVIKEGKPFCSKECIIKCLN